MKTKTQISNSFQQKQISLPNTTTADLARRAPGRIVARLVLVARPEAELDVERAVERAKDLVGDHRRRRIVGLPRRAALDVARRVGALK